jgi:hypothetical protein
MIRMPVLCPRCHTDQVMKGGKTKVHICNTTNNATQKPIATRRRLLSMRTLAYRYHRGYLEYPP